MLGGCSIRGVGFQPAEFRYVFYESGIGILCKFRYALTRPRSEFYANSATSFMSPRSEFCANSATRVPARVLVRQSLGDRGLRGADNGRSEAIPVVEREPARGVDHAVWIGVRQPACCWSTQRSPSSSAHEITSSFNGKPKATEFRATLSCTLSPSACR